MNKLPRMFAVILVCFASSSCQRRALCKIKTSTGGLAFTRVYENTYNDEDEYNDAIATLKAEGYSCDDSVE